MPTGSVPRVAVSITGKRSGASGTSREPRSRRTEQVIFAATLVLMHELGPSAVTIERVAERSGVARSTIYRRWTDIDRLFLDAFTEMTRLGPQTLIGDVDSDLRGFARAYAANLDDVTFREVLVVLMDAALRSRPHRTTYRAITRQRERRAEAIVRAAVARGELPDGTDARAVAVAVMAPLFHQRIATHRPVTEADADGSVDRALREARAGW
jgi:AcrR family transcriptional regulator